MASHSRLGMGLGALFPEIPVKTEKNNSDVSRETSEADNARSAVAPVKTEKTESEKQQQARQNSKPSHGGRASKRPHMPSLADSLHPADLFFASTTSADEEKKSSDSEKPLPKNPIAGTETHNETRTESRAHDKTPADRLSPSAATLEKPVESTADNGTLKPIAGAYFAELNVDDIAPNEHQPRTIFDEDELNELAASIKEVGVLEPIIVRKRDNWSTPYELVMGERRLRASKMAGNSQVPAIVKTTADDQMLREALLENLHRVSLNPLEEAAAYQQMMSEFNITQAQLAQSVAKSRSQIANTLRLLNLPPSVQKKVAAGVLSAGHARALLALKDATQMEPLANRIIAEGLSVRSTEELVALKNGAAGKQKKRARTVDVWSGSETVQQLADHFETKVAIKGTKNRGRIEIAFTSEDDLKRILNLMGSKQTDSAPSADGWF